MNIVDAIHSRKVFGALPVFKHLETWAAWIVCLKGIFALPMNAAELGVFKTFTGRTKSPEKPPEEAWLVIGRRGGKSFVSALVAVFLAVFHKWNLGLDLGYIMVIASDRRQAGVVFHYIRDILRLPAFGGLVASETKETIELTNRIVISVQTCSYRSLRGFTVCAAICDEIGFWRDANSANPAGTVLNALRPAFATVPGSLLMGISTPYARVGPLFEVVRDRFGQDNADLLVWRAASRDMNPTIKQAVVDKALKADFAAGRAEWLAEFREDLETFLSTEMIEQAVIPGRWELPKITGPAYHAFTDPSGGRSDSFTLAVAHKETSGVVVLDCLREKKPPFAPQDVVREFAKVLRSFGLGSVQGDRYAAEFVTSAFRDAGIQYQPAEKDKSAIYLEFEPLMAQGRIALLDHKGMVGQLRGLERRTRSGGRDFVDHYPGGHDDLANVVAGVCMLASGVGAGSEPRIDWIGRGEPGNPAFDGSGRLIREF